jgi:hypothetical protein
MGKGNIAYSSVKLGDYIQRYQVTPHPFYEHFGSDLIELPVLTEIALSQCCRRRPIVLLERGNKRFVVDRRYCYVHGCLAINRGHNEISVIIQEIKNVMEEQVFLSVFLDSLQPCPLIKIKPLYRAEIVASAYIHKDYVKGIFDCKSFAMFCQPFDIAPATQTRSRQLETAERSRLMSGKYKKRGKSIPKTSEHSKQDNPLPVAVQDKPRSSPKKTKKGGQGDLF